MGASKVLTHLFIDDDDLQEYKQLIDGVSRYRVLVFDKRAAGVNERFNDFVTKRGYEELFYLNDEGTLVNLYTYSRFGKIKEVIFNVKDGGDMVVISAEGNNIKLGNVQRDLSEVVKN